MELNSFLSEKRPEMSHFIEALSVSVSALLFKVSMHIIRVFSNLENFPHMTWSWQSSLLS